jgi:thioesterase domain-containing protein
VLDPIQPFGALPPLFMVHGVPGFMPLGPSLVQMLGCDRPVYAIHARGLDGKETPLKSIHGMIDAYLAEIREARPSGPYVIGGMCIGGLIALEIARKLTDRGERVGSVLLLDPLPVLGQWAGLIDGAVADDPKIYRQLHRYLTDFLTAITRQWPNIPFNLNDPRQLHNAVKLAMTNIFAAHAHLPMPYAGATELVICEQRASAYFHPASPWRKLVERPAKVHVLPGDHADIFNRHRASTCRLVALGLEGAFEP